MTTVHTSRGKGRAAASLVLFIAFVLSANAADPPDSIVNPLTGFIETVDVATSGGVSHVRHTTTISPNVKQIATLTAAETSDASPRIAVSAAGATWVTWVRSSATPRVFVIGRTSPVASWVTEKAISSAGQAAASARIAHDGSRPWVAFESGSGLPVSIAVCPGDDPNPIPDIIGTTSFAGDRDLTISAESSHLWVTWVDSATEVGWVKYDYASHTWSAVGHEPYNGDSVGAARSRIRASVIGQ